MKCAIIGGSGYIGINLVKLLLNHPKAKLVKVTSESNAGKKISQIYPSLLKKTELEFTKYDKDLDNIDIVFLSLPHGYSMNFIPNIIKKYPEVKIIDLSGDYRIKSKQDFEKYYKTKHSSHELQSKFVYGISEINNKKIKNAQYIANSGCFSTSAILGIKPLVNIIEGNVIINSLTGSSGSGKTPSVNTHHPVRAQNAKAYKIFKHQHTPEICQELQHEVIITPHSISLVKGIFTTCYLNLKEELSKEEITKLYKEYYKNSYFIRIIDSVEVNNVINTNFCDIAVNVSGKHVIVTSAIDNLIKGGAGQAIQNMNLMFGLDETTGLK